MGDKVDVLIVGAGISGSAALARLHSLVPKANILVVDRGTDVICSGDIRTSAIVRLPITMQSTDRPDVSLFPWWTDHRIGGAANNWYGQISHFEPIDFSAVDFSGDGGSSTHSDAWPFNRRTLDPYYEFIGTWISPVSSGPALEPGTLLPRGWTSRTRIGRAERTIYDVLSTGGWHPFSGATCMGGHAWSADPVDPESLTSIRLRGPSDHARNPVWHTKRIARECDGIRLWGDAHVLFFEAHGEGALVHVNRGGCLISVYARFVVLACGALETVPLLKRSGVIHERLGHNFTLTTEATAYIATDVRREPDPEEQAITRIASVSTKKLYVPNVLGLAKGGKISAYDARGFEGDARHEAKIRAATGGDPNCLSSPSRLTVKLSFKGESVAYEGKRIVLFNNTPQGKAHLALDYTPHPHDRRLLEHVRAAFQEIASLFPGGRIIAVEDNIYGADRSSAHHHGGAVCGTSPELSVLTHDCAVRGLQCCFVADASAMPSSGATNSSLTVMAIAARVGSTVAKKL